MDISQLISAFRDLPMSSQVESLVRLAHELTIVARETYEPSSSGLLNPRRLRCLNEVLHRVTSHVLALLAADSGRYPDEVLVSIVLEQDDPVLREQVAAAFARSLSQPVA